MQIMLAKMGFFVTVDSLQSFKKMLRVLHNKIALAFVLDQAQNERQLLPLVLSMRSIYRRIGVVSSRIGVNEGVWVRVKHSRSQGMLNEKGINR